MKCQRCGQREADEFLYVCAECNEVILKIQNETSWTREEIEESNAELERLGLLKGSRRRGGVPAPAVNHSRTRNGKPVCGLRESCVDCPMLEYPASDCEKYAEEQK